MQRINSISMQTVCKPAGRRKAFSLMELLVAVTIIIILMGMLLVGMGNILGSSREAATRTTLKKVHEILKQQQNEFNLVRERTKIPRFNEPCLPESSEQLMEILHWKRKYREAFPQRYADLFDQMGKLTPIGKKVESIAVRVLVEEGSPPTPPNISNAAVEARMQQMLPNSDSVNGKSTSSELLYLILTEGAVQGVATSDSDQFSANEVQDIDGDGLMEIVDGWGNPVYFYRWPTRMIRPCDPENPTAALAVDPVRANLPAVSNQYWAILAGSNLDSGILGRDGDDPLSWLSKTIRTNLSVVELNSNNTCTFHTPDTYAPLLVVSMGADQELGLFEPNDTTNYGHLAQPSVRPEDAADSALNDNITNLQGLQ